MQLAEIWTLPRRRMTSIFTLQAYTQNSDWVNLESTSKASAYARVATPGFEIDEKKPYAEVGHRLLLWITPTRPISIFCPAN